MKVLSIIIPVYNEEKTISTVLDVLLQQEIKGWKKEIIVVNDGSTDSTAEILKKYKKNITLLHHKLNCGRGTAVRSGIQAVTGDAVIFQDADLEYNPQDIQKLIQQLNPPSTAVVYGNRMNKANKKGYLTHYLGNKIMTFVANLLFGTKLHDTYTGYKLYTTSLLKSLDLKSTGFELEAEITALVLKKNILIKEVFIRYEPRTYKEGKKILFNDGIIGIWTLLKLRFS